MNVFDYVAWHEKPRCVVVKYTQSYATESEIREGKFGRIKAPLRAIVEQFLIKKHRIQEVVLVDILSKR